MGNYFIVVFVKENNLILCKKKFVFFCKGGMSFCLPKLMENVDQDTLKEVQGGIKLLCFSILKEFL